MKKKEQSSIEWLISQIKEDQLTQAKTPIEWSEIYEQAKQLHKKEIIDFGYLQINYIEAEIGDSIFKKVPEEIYAEKYSTE